MGAEVTDNTQAKTDLLSRISLRVFTRRSPRPIYSSIQDNHHHGDFPLVTAGVRGGFHGESQTIEDNQAHVRGHARSSVKAFRAGTRSRLPI